MPCKAIPSLPTREACWALPPFPTMCRATWTQAGDPTYAHYHPRTGCGKSIRSQWPSLPTQGVCRDSLAPVFRRIVHSHNQCSANNTLHPPTRLIYRQFIVAVPLRNTFDTQIAHGHGYVRTLGGHDNRRGPADIASADTAYIRYGHCVGMMWPITCVTVRWLWDGGVNRLIACRPGFVWMVGGEW